MESNINLYNWPFMYKVNQNDMNGFEKTIFDTIESNMDGIYGGAVLTGLYPEVISSNTVRVHAGGATAPNGRLMVAPDNQDLTIDPPATLQEKMLVVIRTIDIPNASMTDPTNVNNVIDFRYYRTYQLVVIRGTPSATPVYPSKVADTDTVLFGVFLRTGSSITNGSIDWSVRDTISKNRPNRALDNKLGDDKLRPYRAGPTSIGIKPSVLGYNAVGSVPRTALDFVSVDKEGPFLYPKLSTGAFTPTDAVVNLATGVWSGGDELSPSFTPAGPAGAGRYMFGLIEVDKFSKCRIKYSPNMPPFNADTCYTDIFSTSSPLLPDASCKLICYFILYSSDGATWSDVQVIDARTPASVPNPKKTFTITLTPETDEQPVTVNRCTASFEYVERDGFTGGDWFADIVIDFQTASNSGFLFLYKINEGMFFQDHYQSFYAGGQVTASGDTNRGAATCYRSSGVDYVSLEFADTLNYTRYYASFRIKLASKPSFNI